MDMKTLRTVVRARTTFGNSCSSDAYTEVLHDVEVKCHDGLAETVRLMAADPLDARVRVQNLSATEYASLARA